MSSPGTTKLYHLAGEVGAEIAQNEHSDELTDPSIEVTNGNVRMQFTRPLTLSYEGSVPIVATEDIIMLWATGSEYALEYHGNSKGSFAIRLDGQTAASGLPSSPL